MPRNRYTFTTQAQVRESFWDDAASDPTISRKRLTDGDYNTDTRCAFADYVDGLARSGEISEALADRVTL